MTTADFQHDVVNRAIETEAGRHARIAREEAIIAVAECDIDAGRGIDEDDLEAWLDTLETDASAPIPCSKGAVTRR